MLGVPIPPYLLPSTEPAAAAPRCIGYHEGCGCDRCLSLDRHYQAQLDRANQRKIYRRMGA